MKCYNTYLLVIQTDTGPYSFEQFRSIYDYVLNQNDVSMDSPKGSPMSDISEPSSQILDALNEALEREKNRCVEQARVLLLKKKQK